MFDINWQPVVTFMVWTNSFASPSMNLVPSDTTTVNRQEVNRHFFVTAIEIFLSTAIINEYTTTIKGYRNWWPVIFKNQQIELDFDSFILQNWSMIYFLPISSLRYFSLEYQMKKKYLKMFQFWITFLKDCLFQDITFW